MILQWHQSLEGGLETGALAIDHSGVLGGSMDLWGRNRGDLSFEMGYVVDLKSLGLLNAFDSLDGLTKAFYLLRETVLRLGRR